MYGLNNNTGLLYSDDQNGWQKIKRKVNSTELGNYVKGTMNIKNALEQVENGKNLFEKTRGIVQAINQFYQL